MNSSTPFATPLVASEEKVIGGKTCPIEGIWLNGGNASRSIFADSIWSPPPTRATCLPWPTLLMMLNNCGETRLVITPEQQGEFRLTTMTKKDRKKALAVAESIRQRIEEMERDPERQYADNFIGVLNLTRADLVNTYGSVWMSKSQYSRDLMGSSRFVISRTTVAPKATQSEPDAPIAGTLVLTKPMVTWLQITYGMDEEFLANRSPSWVTWLDQQRLDGVDPNDAMLVAPFVPDFNEVLPPHLPEPVLVPEVYRHDKVYGVPVAGGSRDSQSFTGPDVNPSSSDLEGLSMDIDQDTVGSSSLESMDQGLNEAIKDEDDLKVEEVGPPHEVREGGHPYCVDADHGRIVVPTLKGGPPYQSFCAEFCLIAGVNIPFESYITPAKEPYAVRECELVDNSVSLTAGTLYPLLSNLAAIQCYDQYHHVLPLSILGRGGEGAICCRYMDTCKQWIKRQLFCEDAEPWDTSPCSRCLGMIRLGRSPPNNSRMLIPLSRLIDPSRAH